MRTLFVLLVGIVIGACGFYFYEQQPGAVRFGQHELGRTPNVSGARDAASDAAAKTRNAAADFSTALNEKMQAWHLTPDDIHADLQKGGAVVRENAARASEKVADVRIITVIKAKYVLDRDLQANAISVESTDGNVTLTGTVPAESLLGKAVALALDTDGVHHVTAKLTVKP